jgi:hypothetical protein
VYPRPVLARQYIRRRRSRRQWTVEPGPNLTLLQPSDVDGTVTPAHDLRARVLNALHVGHNRACALQSGEVRQAGSGLDHAPPPAHTVSTRSLKDDPKTRPALLARKAYFLALFELHHDDVLDSLPNAVDSPIYDTA